jgi:GntR family transcriptional regulator
MNTFNDEINKSLPIVLYQQLKDSLLRKIISDEWRPGSRIPSESEICELYGVSRMTVRQAVNELARDGYLEKKQGKGTFVLKKTIEQKLSKFYSFSEHLAIIGKTESSKLLSFSLIEADPSISSELRVANGVGVFKIVRARYVDDTPYAYECSYITERFAPGLTGEMIEANGLYKTLNSFGVYMSSATERFKAVNTTNEISNILQVKRNDAAISLDRITYCGFDVVEFCQSVIRGDTFSYVVELR